MAADLEPTATYLEIQMAALSGRQPVNVAF